MESPIHPPSEPGELRGGEEQFLTFTLSGEEYGIPILEVQEIKGWNRVTPVPNSPAYVRGILNLRGLIVPVMDMRLRFGLPERAYDAFTAVVVVKVRARLAGLVVDSVNDVISLTSENRRALPDFEGRDRRPFIRALAQRAGRRSSDGAYTSDLLILLDVGRLVGVEGTPREGTGADERAVANLSS